MHRLFIVNINEDVRNDAYIKELNPNCEYTIFYDREDNHWIASANYKKKGESR